MARDYGSLGYGEGYATAETSICNLVDTVLTARGERSRFLGPDARYADHVTLDATNLQSDTLFSDIRNRGWSRSCWPTRCAAPGRQTRAMVKGYAAGVNAYLRDIGGSRTITDPACKGARWVRPDATAKDIWYAVYAANLLASTGVFVPQIAGRRAADPASRARPVPATRPCPRRARRARSCSPSWARTPTRRSAPTRPRSAPTPPPPAAAWCSATRTSPGAGRYRFTQFHLTIPGEYDVAGAGLIGSPVVNIGWNKRRGLEPHRVDGLPVHAVRVQDGPGHPTLPHRGRPQELEHRTVEVGVKRKDGTVSTVSRRTSTAPEEGYVLDAPDALMPWLPTSFLALRDANAEHLRTVDTFHAMGKATGVRDLLRRQDRGGGMPWVNTTAADRSRQRALRRPLGRAQRARRPREGVPHPGRGGAQPGGRPARARRHPGRGPPARGAPTRTRSGRGLRPGQPAQHGPQGLGDQRQRQLLAAQPGPAAGGLRRDHRLRAVRALACASGWSTATSSTGSPAATAWRARAARSATAR